MIVSICQGSGKKINALQCVKGLKTLVSTVKAGSLAWWLRVQALPPTYQLCDLEQVTSPLCACFCVYKTDIGITTLQASSVLPACGCFTADLGSDGAEIFSTSFLLAGLYQDLMSPRA